jgi:hypothetical protein
MLGIGSAGCLLDGLKSKKTCRRIAYTTFLSVIVDLRLRFCFLRRFAGGIFCRWIRKGEGDGGSGAALNAAFIWLALVVLLHHGCRNSRNREGTWQKVQIW